MDVMQRTHASLSRKAGIDPKLVADQLGMGSEEIWTSTRSPNSGNA
jgi:lambda repressor-like predicted transcriptional regulator